MSKDRYPGAPPFKESQASIFFGRDKETEELYQLIRKESLVVLYAKSGLGKSSMLNAGVIPKARQEGAYQPLTIRFHAYEEDKESQKTAAAAALERIRSGDGVSTFLTKLIETDNSIWRALKERQLSGAQEQGTLLLFDQFEELFTYPPQAQLQFRKELAEALYTPLPQRYWDMLDLYGPEEMPLTPEQLVQLQEPLQLRVVVAIRHDRMHLLGQLSDYLPSISKNWYELRSLDRSAASTAILSPAAAEGAFDSPPFIYTEKAVGAMLDFLEGKKKADIEGTQLQIICNEIENRVKNDVIQKKDKAEEFIKVEPADLGSLSQIIENYYEEKITAIEDPAQQLAARHLVEEGLIFDAEERRLSIYQGQIFKEFGLEPATLLQLEKSHLLRAEPSLRGGYTYELSHDTLVPPILKAKKERLEKEQAQKDAEDKKRQAQLLEDEKRKRRHAGWVAIGMAVLAIIAVGMAIWALSILTDLRQEKNRRMGLQRREWKETAEIFQEAGFVADAQKIEEYIKQRPLPEDSVIRSGLTPFETILAEASKVDDTLYRQAIQLYSAAERRDPTRAKEVESLILKVFDDINNLWRAAEAAKEEALAAKEEEKTAKEETARLKLKIHKWSSSIVQDNSVDKNANPSSADLNFPNPKWERNTEEIKIREEDYIYYETTMQFFEQNKFARAEEILRKGLQTYPTSKRLKRYLPHTLLLQEKTEDAKEAYLELKSKPFSQTFAEVFLSDLSAFESQGLIPEDLKAEVAEIQRLLEQ